MGNVMIIYPKPDENKSPRFGFSYDMMIIATVLANEGNNVIIKDFSCEGYDYDKFCADIEDSLIDLVLIEFDSFALKRSENYSHGSELTSIIKRINAKLPVIAYGHYCYITKEDVYPADDTIKINCFNAIFESINRSKTLAKQIRSFSDYDSLPLIRRALLNQIDYYYKNRNSTLIKTADGCENSCIFCQRKGWQRGYQAHSDRYVLDEFMLLKEQRFGNIWIVDDNFAFNLERAKRILRLLIDNNITEKMKISISTWSNIDEEFLDLAAMSNIKVISMGIESGNQSILDFYKKNINLEKTKSILRYANKQGLFTVGNFILGAPMESYQTIEETFNFIRECEFDQVNLKTLDYMMGSELYESIIDIAKGRSHLFACLENGFNQFRLQEIIDIKHRFLVEYNKENKERVMRKLIEFGMPYEEMR